MDKGWQSGKTLIQCHAYMLKYKPYADVTFHVGPKRQAIKAHKYVLLSRSPIFCETFSESSGSHLDDIYTVPDVDPAAFNNFLRYLYCDQVDLNSKTVTPLLHVARKYEVGTLVKKCMNTMGECISDETVCTILEQAHLCKEETLQNECLAYIFRHAHASLKSESFLELCPTCVKQIIESDHLRADETVVYEAMVKWATQEVKRRRQKINDDNRMRALGELKYLIRFPVMDIDFFTRNVSTHNILDKDEKIALFQYFHSKIDIVSRGFNPTKRSVGKVVRYEGTSGFWSVGSFLDAIKFKTNEPIILDGVLIYGAANASSEYDVTAAILDDKNTELQRKTAIILTDSKQETYPLIFNSSEDINENTWYTITLKMAGPQTKRGIKGKKIVHTEMVEFEFQDSKLAHNCSTEKEGQIPGLVYHLAQDTEDTECI